MHITIHQLEQFLSGKYKSVTAVEHLADGWWAQAFVFNCEDGKFVIRISRQTTDFKKDRYAFQHYNSVAIPIPLWKEMGRFNEELNYCITTFCEGNTADNVMRKVDDNTSQIVAVNSLMPLYQIHRLPVASNKGWGFTDEAGNGRWESWTDFLLAIFNQKYQVSWQELAKTTYLNGDLFEKLERQMKELFPYLPKEKKVLHGDYGFDNLLLNDRYEVTAVLDWAEMLLGDELYDLVHMNEPWNEDEVQYLPIWTAYKASQQEEVLHLKERLQCYHIHYTLFHLHIHTTRNEEEDYAKIEQWASRRFL
jgi:hygromycin-B 4-O-kinase